MAALPRRFESKRTDKIRPKSCEIVTRKSEWKRSFENRKSFFEQSTPPPHPPENKRCVSSITLDKPLSQVIEGGYKEVSHWHTLYSKKPKYIIRKFLLEMKHAFQIYLTNHDL